MQKEENGMQFDERAKSQGHNKQASIYNFLPVALLGEGSYGQVYLVEDINTGRKFAMKKLDKNQIEEQNMMRYT